MSNPRPPSSATTSARSRQRPDLTRATASTTSRTTTTTSRLATTQAAKPTTSRLINGKAASGTSSKEISKKSPSNAGSTNGSSQNALKRSRDNPASASSPSPRQQITESSSSKTSLRVSKSESKAAESSNKQTPATSNTLNSLQLAAQIYPWTYMTASLEAAMSKAEITAQESFAAKEKELDEQEAGIADLRIRYEIECVLALYDELGKQELVDALPRLLDVFIEHGLEATRLSDEALRLASLDVTQVDFMSPVLPYNTILDSLDDALKQTDYLSSSFTTLIQTYDLPESSQCPAEDSPNPYDPRPRLSAAFSALLSILQARHANLTLSQEVVMVLKDNVEAHLKVESLRLASNK